MNILVVSDIRIYREGLREVLARNEQINVVGTTSTLKAALCCLVQSTMDVVLIDVGTAESLVLTKECAVNFPQTKVVAFGLTDSKREIIEYAEAGISGYVSKDACVADLVKVILRAHQGELHCSAQIAGALIERLSKLAREKRVPSSCDGLTSRELQIAELVSRGLTNSEIAVLLKIRVATTKTHVHHILEKLGVRRRGEVNNRLNDRYGSRADL
ncbi:MAG: response regulator transcription factor [Candidatus Thiodiazotropha sp. L084R]